MRICPDFSASRTAPVALTAVLLGLLTACSDPAPPAPTPMAPAPSPPASPVTAVREEEPQAAAPSPTTQAAAAPAAPKKAAQPRADLDRFVTSVRERLPEVMVDRRDEEVAMLGEQTCAEIGRGRQDAAVVAGLREQGLTASDARTIVALARSSACPA